MAYLMAERELIDQSSAFKVNLIGNYDLLDAARILDIK